jgi:hypothetical protein
MSRIYIVLINASSCSRYIAVWPLTIHFEIGTGISLLVSFTRTTSAKFKLFQLRNSPKCASLNYSQLVWSQLLSTLIVCTHFLRIHTLHLTSVLFAPTHRPQTFLTGCS